ncbi:MAG: hypothetical protein K8W52_28060 [Deltaproteobacteria bacterium]|nr:hypothetical protein [Deltaproteobacteria bacterium]
MSPVPSPRGRGALALAGALTFVGCVDAPDPAVDTAEHATLSGPDPKLTAAYVKLLHPFGFEENLIANGYRPSVGDVPAPREVPLLLVLAERRAANPDGSCPDIFPRPSDEIEDIVFGGGMPSIRNYFAASSHGRLLFTRAGVAHVCGLPATTWYKNEDLVPAVLAAIDPTVHLGAYDREGDGVVSSEELTILVLDDWASDHGQTLGMTVGITGGSYRGFIATGSAAAPFFVWAHELGHTLGADDLYGAASAFNDGSTLYGATPADAEASIDMDAWTKFRLGWLRPALVELGGKASGSAMLACGDTDLAEVSGAVLFHDPARGTDEYFLAEARCQRDYDAGTPERGVAIWQVLQQPDTFEGSAVFGMYRSYAKGWDGCAAGPTGEAMCTTPSVCLHDVRSDNRDVCRASHFLRERKLFAPWLPLWWADRSPAGIELAVAPMIEYVDYGIPGYHHVEHLLGYELTWRPH